MRIDKLTTAFQQALAESQSLAVARDNPYIEPAHVLAAMLQQPDGPKALLDRAGANGAALKTAMDTAIGALPSVQGGGQVQPGRDLVTLLQAAEKEAGKRGDNFIASEMFLLALADSKTDLGGVVRGHGLTRKALEAAIEAVRGGQKVDSAEAEGQPRARHGQPGGAVDGQAEAEQGAGARGGGEIRASRPASAQPVEAGLPRQGGGDGMRTTATMTMLAKVAFASTCTSAGLCVLSQCYSLQPCTRTPQLHFIV
jgi:ATP-dependent Clp protease ATP-binding subunit ClpA